MAFIEPSEGELQTAEEIASARQAFLNNPDGSPPPSTTPVVAEGSDADEQAAIEELLNKPPAGQEGAAAEGSSGTPSAPAAPAPAPAPTGTFDPYAQFGGEEAVRTAKAVQDALRTEQGLRALVANGLLELGYDINQVRAALDGAEAGVDPDPFADVSDDDVFTAAQTKQLVERAVQQALAASQEQVAPVQQILAEQQQATVRATTDAAVIEALGPVPTDPAQRAAYAARVDAIVERGARYYDPNQWANPQHIRQAVVQANAELEAESESRFQAYLATKRSRATGTPPNTGGGAGADAPLPEPKNLAEARAQARAGGFFD